MILNFVTQVFPLVQRELDYWRLKAQAIPDPELRLQALASIEKKKFHAQGGSIYALYPNTKMVNAVRFIVALQTISDYLDNLCDRAGVLDETAFFQLHRAMGDATEPERPISDYYSLYPFSKDGGYLANLVAVCRAELKRQSAYPVVLPIIRKYVKWYSELQSYKHVALNIRENLLRNWALQNLKFQSAIHWWEFAAATGSTLEMFLLYALASIPELNQDLVEKVDRAYFPWIAGLHILLDYYIDVGEDLEMGDFNFTAQYCTLQECQQRMEFFLRQAVTACRSLPYPVFHLTVIRGLLAMYLSDPKALIAQEKAASLTLVRNGGMKSQIYYRCCLLLRKMGRI